MTETIVPLEQYERSKSGAGRKVRLVRGPDFSGHPPARLWHVEPLIPARTVTLLGGDGGTGKSLLSMQLAVATAAPRPMKWCGRTAANGPVIYISAEDDQDELHRRVRAICEANELDPRDLDRLAIIPLAGEDAVLALPDKGGMKTTPLFTAIEERIAEERPALVVADTLADLFGGQENERTQSRQFIGMLRGWAIRFDTSLLLLNHPSLSGLSSGSGTSGSTGWSNSVRSRLYLDRVKDDSGFEPDPDARSLKTLKANYGRTGGEIMLRWQNGLFVTTDTGATTMLGAIAETSRADRVFLHLLHVMTAEGRHVSPNPNARNYAPTVFDRHPQAEGIRKRGFDAAMQRLFSSGKITVGKSAGAPSRQTDIIVEKAA